MAEVTLENDVDTAALEAGGRALQRAASGVRARSMRALIDSSEDREPDPALAELDDRALEDSIRAGASQLAAATCRWLEMVAELTRRGIWAQQRFSTPATWLSWAVSMGSSTAREHVRVALSLADWPQLHEVFRRGRISYSKVRAITRYGDPAVEQLLLEYARHADGAQLERILRTFDEVMPADEEQPVHTSAATCASVRSTRRRRSCGWSARPTWSRGCSTY